MALNDVGSPTIQERVRSLSQREKDCLRGVQAGLNSKEIGIRENLSEHTVNSHVKSALRKLGLQDRREAARALHEHDPLSRPTPPTPSAVEQSLLAELTPAEIARLLRTRGRPRLIELNGPEMTAVERLAAIAAIVVLSLVFISLVFALVGFSFRELSRAAGHGAAANAAEAASPPPGNMPSPPNVAR
jgi:DNA-binding CsgD family transcriptional regulator